MKTKYFQTISLSSAGKRRFKSLASLPQDARVALIKWVSELDTMPRVYGPVIKEIARCTGAPADILGDAVNIALDALSDLGKFGDSSDDFMADTRTCNLLDEDEQYSALAEFIEATLQYAQRIHLLNRVVRTEDSGAPLLRNTSSSVAIKPVFDHDFEYGLMDVSDYQPEVVQYTPVAQIELLLQNQSESVTFQVSEDTLDRFLSDLLALQAQMKSAREVVDSQLKLNAGVHHDPQQS